VSESDARPSKLRQKTRALMQKIGESHRFQVGKDTKNRCAVVFLVIRDIDDGYTIDTPKHSKTRSEASRTDSESQFWQQKNFSRLAPWRLIGARQTPIPARIEYG
jgi:hypothetical protein